MDVTYKHNIFAVPYTHGVDVFTTVVVSPSAELNMTLLHFT